MSFRLPSALSRTDQNPLIANGQDSYRAPHLLHFETCNFDFPSQEDGTLSP